MNQLTCEMCGSKDLLKEDGVFVCQSCGCKYSVEEAKRMMVEGTVDVKGTVTVDNSIFVKKSLDNAHRALRKEDWEEVEKYYNLVEQNAPNNMEAIFFSSYGKAMLSLSDSDFFKRQQKFEVLQNSISIISDCYEDTIEDKEAVIRMINDYIHKMFDMRYVYERQGISLEGALNLLNEKPGTKNWNIALFNLVQKSFNQEIQQIYEQHSDPFLKQLLEENHEKPLSVIQQEQEEQEKQDAEQLKEAKHAAAEANLQKEKKKRKRRCVTASIISAISFLVTIGFVIPGFLPFYLPLLSAATAIMYLITAVTLSKEGKAIYLDEEDTVIFGKSHKLLKALSVLILLVFIFVLLLISVIGL